MTDDRVDRLGVELVPEGLEPAPRVHRPIIRLGGVGSHIDQPGLALGRALMASPAAAIVEACPTRSCSSATRMRTNRPLACSRTGSAVRVPRLDRRGGTQGRRLAGVEGVRGHPRRRLRGRARQRQQLDPTSSADAIPPILRAIFDHTHEVSGEPDSWARTSHSYSRRPRASQRSTLRLSRSTRATSSRRTSSSSRS